jgi:flavin-dependent dehydrogenase
LNKNCDLFILGAGLTGCILAIELLKKSPRLKVIIADKKRIDVKRVGESCSDLTSIYLNLNLPDHILKKHTIKTGLRFLFQNNLEFSSPSQKSTANGYQLNRALFDKDLREEAVKLGAIYLEETKVLDFIELASFKTMIHLESQQEDHKIQTRWFVDCSGRSRFLQKKFNWKQNQNNLSTASSWIHIKPKSHSWDSKKLEKWYNQGIGGREQATMHFFGRGYWAWYFPLEDKTSSLGIVYDKNLLSKKNPRVLFEQVIKENEYLSEIVSNDTIEEFHHLDELCYYPQKMFKKGFLTLGDSSSFIDPLFSSGMELAIQQNLYFSDLLMAYFEMDEFNEKKWLRTEKLFIKSFKSRLLTFSTRYRIMHHFDIFTNWAQLDFLGYFHFHVIPSVYFPKIFLRKPVVFNKLSLIIYNFFMKRYEKLCHLKDEIGMESSVFKSKVIFSETAAPQNKFFAPLKTLHLFWLWFSYYLSLELKIFIGRKKAK